MESIVNFVTILISVVGAAIIIYGAVFAFYLFIKDLLKRFHKNITLNIDHIRLVFGRYIILGLEFFIAADMIETIYVPTFQEIGVLASLIGIRTILSFFLTRELEKLSDKEKQNLK